MPTIADRINAFLSSQHSPMAGLGAAYVNAGSKYGVDPLLMVAISGQESSFGKYEPSQPIHNAWGWGPNIPFPTWQAGINAIAKGLASGYLSQGRTTIPEIASKWAPVGAGNDPTNLNSNWVQGVSKFYGDLGGTSPQVPSYSAPSPVPGPTPTLGPISFPMGAQVPVQSLIDRYGTYGMGGLTPTQYAQQQLFGGQGLPDPMQMLAAASQARTSPLLANPSLSGLLTSLRPGGPGAAPAGAPTASTVSAQVPSVPSIPSSTPGTNTAVPDLGDWVKVSPTANRPGAEINPAVLQFVGTIAHAYGKPLTVGTGTNHDQFVSGYPVGERHQSGHWTGDAVDIPMSGDALTSLGRTALVMAGMDPIEASKVKGGVFRLNGYNILFNTNRFGNHYNHLHVGLLAQ